MTPNLSPGWVLADQFTVQSGVVAVPAGAGVLGVARQVVLQERVGPAARAWLQQIDFRMVDDGGYDQIIFMLCRNGNPIDAWSQISATQITLDPTVPINQEFEAAVYTVEAMNISGTSWPGADPDGAAVRVVARLIGNVLRKSS